MIGRARENRRSLRVVQKGILLVGGAVGAIVLLLVILFVVWIGSGFWHLRARRAQLLEHTEAHMLLAACEEVIASRGHYQANPDISGGGTQDELRLTYPDPQDPRMLEVIRRLRPTYLLVRESSVKLEMGGGPHHFGVVALAHGVRGDEASWQLPRARELVAGLWYYEDD